MGCCGSRAPDAGLDRVVAHELAGDKIADAEVFKLLLLGAGGSGKSTFFKQLRTLHGDGHSERELDMFKSQIVSQIIGSMQTLLSHCKAITEKLDKDNVLLSKITGEGELKQDSDDDPNDDDNADDNDDEELAFSKALISSISTRKEMQQYRLELDDSTRQRLENVMKHDVSQLSIENALNDAELCSNIVYFWSEPSAVKRLFTGKHQHIGVPNSSAYFFDCVRRIWHGGYRPTDEDVLHVRFRTTGMVEDTFRIHDSRFHVVDVGGQRNERKKWLHFFDNVTAVLFVVSLVSYDEIPFEDVGKLQIAATDFDLDHLDFDYEANTSGESDSDEDSSRKKAKKQKIGAGHGFVSGEKWGELVQVPSIGGSKAAGHIVAANHMIESMEVFQGVLDEDIFAETLFVLFFNKTDLMKHKIRRVPITTAFPEYSGAQTYEGSVKYIMGKFTSLNDKTKCPRRKLKCHQTCATDTEAAGKLFSVVEQSVIDWTLERAGLISMV